MASAAFGQRNGQRYYDRAHKDYHTWSSAEKTQYGVWASSNHVTVTFAKAPATQRQAYWNWRHDHPDGK
jgi:hypothetical protein